MLPRWLITFRALALAAAFAAAFVPLATYITDDKRDWLWIHIGVNIAAYLAVALTTIMTTASLMQQDHHKYRVPAYWADNVVMQTWWLGVSKTWRWHVAAAVGRLGLALALAQHLDVSCGYNYGCTEDHFIFTPHIYQRTGEAMTSPVWETVVIAFLVLFGFSVLETALVSAFTTLFGFARSSRSLSFVSPLLMRLSIIFLFVQILLLFDTPQSLPSYIQRDQDYKRGYDKNIYVNKLEPWYFVAFNWFDDGTMMAAKIIRPPKSYTCYDETKAEEYRKYLTCDFSIVRPNVVVATIEALSAYATYILATAATLQLAHYLHWRREQHAAPTPASP